jgi:RES domain-containing protein
MVYTSSSLALAAMEFFVHLDPSEAPAPLVSVMAEIPENLCIEQVDPDALPVGWRKPNNKYTQQLGTDWSKSRSSVALVVPSAVVDGESNILLNPVHPTFREIKIYPAKPFCYDERMFRRR